MYNKKTLSKATAELDKAKAPKKPKDIITDPMGQWKYPGLPTRIPGNDITMKGVGYPVLGVANNGQRKIMLPGADYTFPGADYVDEYPQMKKGGTKKKRKTKSIMGMNKLMQKGPLFQDYSKRIYDPNVDYFQGGGYIEAELTDDEIEEYRKGGYIVKDISVPELNQAKKGKSVNNTTSSKFTTYTAKNDKDYALRKKAYDDSLALHKLNLEYEKLALKGNQLLTSKRASHDPFPIEYKNLVNKMQYNDALQEKVIKNSNVPHKPVPNAGKLISKITGEKSASHPRPTQMIIKPVEAADIIKKPKPKKIDVVTAPVKVSTKDTVIPTVTAVQSKYPVGYQPYSLYGKVLDPEVYGYAESLNGKPVQVSQFADTYGYKAKMDTYKKSGKYPWVKQKGGTKDKFATHIGEDGTVGTTSVHTDKKGNKTIVVTKDDGTKYTKVISKDGKVYNNTQAGLSPEMRTYAKKKAEWEDRSSGAAQPVDEFWTLPIGMTSAGVKGAVGLVKGLTSLGRNAAKSSLVQAGKAGLKKSLIKSLPGSSINNLVASEFAGTALTDIVTGKVAEPWKKANKSGKVSDYVDAVAENMYTALDAIPLYNAAGKGLKQLGKLAKTQNKSSKLSKVTAYNDALQNEYWPKSLTEHPDAEYVLQKTPVKDFGIRPNIKNLPTKQTRGYDINEKDVHQLINQNLEYLTHPNYIKRRQSVTGETTKQIKKDIDSYINNLKKSDIDLGLNIEYPGGHIRGDRKWFLGKKSKDVTGVNPDKVSSRTEALHVLDHEIGHALSPANQSTFKGMPKYKNYPNLKISKKIDKDGYLGSDYEQQVRFNRIKNYLNNKYGISKHEPISEKDFDLFANDYNKWVNEEHMVQGKGNMPRGMQDIGEMLTGHTQTAGQSAKTRRNIIAGINRSWALAPVGITGAALMNMPKQQKAKQMKKGGIVADLTHAEIQDYIKQGYIVEDVE